MEEKVMRASIIAMGIALITIALIMFAGGAFAQPVSYCDLYPQVRDCVCRNVEEYTYGGGWVSTYCAGGGMLQQERTAFQIIKPDCTSRFKTTLYQQVPQNYCKKCPEPKLLGSWMPTQCAGSNTVMQRNVLAYYYTPTVDKCDVGSFVELKVEKGGTCSNPVGAASLWVTGNYIWAAASIIVIVIIAVIILRR